MGTKRGALGVLGGGVCAWSVEPWAIDGACRILCCLYFATLTQTQALPFYTCASHLFFMLVSLFAFVYSSLQLGVRLSTA